jgi:hypothetical protein
VLVKFILITDQVHFNINKRIICPSGDFSHKCKFFFILLFLTGTFLEESKLLLSPGSRSFSSTNHESQECSIVPAYIVSKVFLLSYTYPPHPPPQKKKNIKKIEKLELSEMARTLIEKSFPDNVVEDDIDDDVDDGVDDVVGGLRGRGI